MPVVQPNIFVQSGGGTQEYTAGDGIDITDNVISNTAIPDVDKDYVDGSITALDSRITQTQTMLTGKQDAPATAGTAGQVLGLNDNLQPVWVTGGGGGGGNYVTLDTEQTITGNKTFHEAKFTQHGYESNYTTALTAYKNEFNGASTLQLGAFHAQGNFDPTGWNNTCLRMTHSGASQTRKMEFWLGVSFSDFANLRWHKTGYNSYALDFDGCISTAMQTISSSNTNNYVATHGWVKSAMPDVTFTGNGSSSYTVSHSLGKIPSIVQVTGPDGVVLKDSEVTITKTTTNVTVAFETAPESGTYTVGMLY